MVPFRRVVLVASWVGGVALLAHPLPATTPVDLPPSREPIDVGSFTMFVNEQRVGREQFSIQRATTADGAVFELRSESAVGDRRTAVRLETDTLGTPLRYSVEERTGAIVTLRLGGQRVRGRFTTLSRSTTGESAREYLLRSGTLVLEDDGVLLYAMVVRHSALAVADSAMLSVITPVANRQDAMHVTRVSRADTVVIAGSKRPAQQWRVASAANDARFVWTDANGRLLRLHIPARGFDAVRDDIPR